MKIGVIQFNPIVGDLHRNVSRMFDFYVSACKQGADIVVFPEMAVTGYPIEDLAQSKSFVSAAMKAGNLFNKMVKESSYSASVIYGNVEGIPDSEKPFNIACVYDKGNIRFPNITNLKEIEFDNGMKFPKLELPNYGVFDEKRVFECGEHFADNYFEFEGENISVAICEDLWHDTTRRFGNSDIIISINGSPFEIGKQQTRYEVAADATGWRKPQTVVYVNMVGGQDELVFDGASFIKGKDGSIYQLPSFEEGVYVVDTDNITDNREICDDYTSDIYRACVLGTRDYLQKQNFDSVVIGMSGGVDSGIVAAIAADAIGPENVHLVRLPSKYSSQHSLDDAANAANRLGSPMRTINIEPVVNALRQAYALTSGEELEGVADENIQARARGTILMAISNQERRILLTTGNKSEVSVGYCVSHDTLISTDQGVFDAEQLFVSYENKTIKGNKITASFKQEKNRKYELTTTVGNTLVCGAEHPVKVYDVVAGITKFVNAENLCGDEILIGSEFICEVVNNAELPFVFQKKKYDFRSPPDLNLPLKIDNQVAQFLGVCVADGSYGSGYYVITTTQSHVVKSCSDFLERVNVSYSIKTEENGINRINILSVELMAWLRFCGVVHLSQNKVVPWAILQSSSSAIMAFCSGLFLDSSLNKEKNTTEMVFNCKNDMLAKQMQFLMTLLGVRSYYKSVSHGRSSVYIPSSETHKLSSLKLKNSLIMAKQDEVRIKPKAGLDYIYFTKEEISEICLALPWEQRATVLRARKTNRLSYGWVSDKVKKGILDSKWLKNNIRFLKLKDVKVVEGSAIMYDFTVENIEQFEANGFTVHNCTLYGDMSGGFNPIKDCYKTTVWAMCRFRNGLDAEAVKKWGFLGPHDTEVVPEEIIVKPPSAELKPDQQDSDSLPPYETLDGILKMLIEKQASILETASVGYETEEVKKVQKLVDRSEYKRRQSAPGVKITSKLHGKDRRIPIVNKYDNDDLLLRMADGD